MIDDPEIIMVERTGYPSWNQPESHYCEECGQCLDDEDMYEDDNHDYLCRECLCSLYEKRW